MLDLMTVFVVAVEEMMDELKQSVCSGYKTFIGRGYCYFCSGFPVLANKSTEERGD